MGWLVKILGPLGWLVDPVAKGAAVIEQIVGALGANASAEAQAAAQVEIAGINASVARAQAAKEIRLATAGFWEQRALTLAIAGPFILHLWLVALDTCFKLGWRVSAFPNPFAEWEGAILLSFFGVSVIGGGIKAFAGAVAYGKRP